MPDSKPSGASKIVSALLKNFPIVVMVSGLVGLHWVWGKIQENPVFVKEEERKPHPFLQIYQKFRDRPTEQ